MKSHTDTTARDPLNILIIGPLPPPLDGASLPVFRLIEGLRKRSDVTISMINISRSRETVIQIIRMALVTLWKTLILGRHANVITFHANQNGRLFFGPLIYLITRCLRRPLVMRAFGGTFDQQYLRIPKIHQWLMRHTYFNAEVCLFETKRLVTFFNSIHVRRSEWYSNSTQDVGLTDNTPFKETCKKLIFVGRVTPTKGIDEILATASLLDEGVSIDIFGPLDATYSTYNNLNKKGLGRIRYRGVIDKNDIAKTLWEYDALVLPTYWMGEGYPAVVLEAYAHGLPVITTRWQSIPEIVDERSGILVEPHDISGLAQAVNHIHRQKDEYTRLQHGARKRFQEFESAYWDAKFTDFCYAAAGNKPKEQFRPHE